MPSLFTESEEPLSRGTTFRTPAVLPLPGLGRMQFLSFLLVKAPPTVFDNDAMAIVLRVLWRDHIRKWFILDFTLYAIFYVSWILLVDSISVNSLDSGLSSEDRKLYVLIVAVTTFTLNTLFALKELVQSDYGRRSGYIKSTWNQIDLLSIVCVWLVSSTVTVSAGFFESARGPLAVITTLLLTVVSP